MRFADLLEDQTDILNDVEELITRAKSRGFTKLSTSTILSKLEAAGYSITLRDLVSLLNGIKSVGSANKVEITLDTALPPDSQEDSDKKVVSKLAAKQLKKKDREL